MVGWLLECDFWNVEFDLWNMSFGIWLLELTFCVGQDSITRVTTLYYGLPQGFLSCHWIWKYVFKPADMFSQYYDPLVIKFSYTKSHFTLKILLKKDIKSSRNSIGWLAQKTSECGTWNVECEIFQYGMWKINFNRAKKIHQIFEKFHWLAGSKNFGMWNVECEIFQYGM